jgi:hypothetical protein
MVTLECLATAGLILGMFFNVYALLASCAAVVLLNFASAFDVGISKATLSFALAIILLQNWIFRRPVDVGTIYTSKTASIPTSRR